ncbi:AraC family transcriptional regulator [Pararhizobium sp.]|uniref:AraC family transcriptional regulator n=1 Tax=Pararhizobium sp. TaxID=1977563 RepID=UPI0027156D76|nr:AraC family transcriptional regulator [Pararhizobium sp.]MDO9414742.1 AraC family transcriptional regulator [Pararhizobium sp.]
MENASELASLIARNAPLDGTFETAIPRVGLVRSSAVTQPVHTLYEPSFCLVARGRKRATVGGHAHVYDSSNYLVVGVDLPIIGAVIEANPEEPFLCVRLLLDRELLAGLLLDHPVEPDAAGLSTVGLGQATPELMDAAVRLLRLLDAPEDIGALAPMAEREILYRLLKGSQSRILRQIANGESRLSKVARALSFMRSNYREAFAIEDLAAIAGMSPSSFYEHFRSATTMSPLQFRTHIRLQEARRLMMLDGISAAEAGFRVGYDSPSQFSRDYTRIFSAPPKRDIARLQVQAGV